MVERFTVAIDGPAAAGKGTISKAVAAHFGLAHLDTGLLYRAVGAKVLAGEDAIEAAQAFSILDMAGDNLRSAEVAAAASQAAVIPQVRAALVAFQHDFAAQKGGAILDGRDIGTVICPQAEVKLFVTASPEVRARRRFQELVATGAQTTFEAVLADVCERDKRDRERKSAPLVAAGDAVIIDTSDMSITAAVARAVAVIKDALSARE